MKVENPEELERELNNIPGVVENGIFTRDCNIISMKNDVIDVK
jgi:ribose 5-phosphate isomerase